MGGKKEIYRDVRFFHGTLHMHHDKVITISAPPYYVVGADNKKVSKLCRLNM